MSVPGDATSSPVEVMSRGLSGAVFIVESEKMEGSDLMINERPAVASPSASSDDGKVRVLAPSRSSQTAFPRCPGGDAREMADKSPRLRVGCNADGTLDAVGWTALARYSRLSI